MKLSYSDSGKDEYQFVSAQKSLSLYKASFKDIYNTLLAGKKEFTSIWVEKWNDSTHIGEMSGFIFGKMFIARC